LAALWGCHPLLTEDVTNIVGRSDMLAGFAVLAALLCHRQALRSAGIRKAAWVAALGASVAIGVFSKENAVVVLAALALYDLSFDREFPVRARIASYAAALVPCIA